MEKPISSIRSQTKAGNSTWNEIPIVKSQESGKTQKNSDLHIHFPLELIPSAFASPGPCHEDFACFDHQEHLVQGEKEEESGMKIARPRTRGRVAVEMLSDSRR